MKKIWTIAWKDYKGYFISPLAYVIFAAFLGLMGVMFFSNLYHFAQQSLSFQQMKMGKGASLTEGIIRPLYGNLNVIYLLIAPAFTMRAFAEEKKLQTIQLLMTSPITLAEMVIGKFLASFLLAVTMFSLTLVYPIILYVTGNPDIGTILTSYMGTILLFSCYLSIGTLFSAMSENQIIAFILTFITSLFFWIVNWMSQFAGPGISDVLDYVSLIQHYNNFSQGMIQSADVIYYFSFIGIGLFLTHRVLDSYRWRS